MTTTRSNGTKATRTTNHDAKIAKARAALDKMTPADRLGPKGGRHHAAIHDALVKQEKKAKTAKPAPAPLAIPCEKAFCKRLAFDHKEVKAEAWVLVYGRQSITVNLYNDQLGKGGKGKIDLAKVTHVISGDVDRYIAKLTGKRGYKQVLPVTECPIARKA